jgi:hypothetical protein
LATSFKIVLVSYSRINFEDNCTGCCSIDSYITSSL